MADLVRTTAIAFVLAERSQQLQKWGQQDANTWPEWLAILTEEVGELAGAINETHFANAARPERGGLDNIRKEAVQVAAVAMSIIERTILEGARK